MVSPLAAIKAYTATQNQGIGGALGAKDTAGPDFGEILKHTIQDTVASSKNAETQMANHTVGKAELVDVVTAVSSAQASLETVMAIRDQVISAYQEVMRMQI